MLNTITTVIQSGVEDGERIPNSYVQSCTECSMKYLPDGRYNVLGALQRQQFAIVLDGKEWGMNCGRCPVHAATYKKLARDANGHLIRWRKNDKALTQHELLILQEDGDYLERYVYVDTNSDRNTKS